ncbi:MAG: 4'-phosphopantetheinyl transferase superfamily protein, partial [Corynebacterium sp.]|nr:4'-phosphopantetheinyl transferase superfamily protein [Corynebacterium sp.]
DVVGAHRRPEGVHTAVASVREGGGVGRGGARVPGRELGTVLFSAKESVYKAWYPLAGRFLDFDEVDMHLEITELGDGPGDEISGTWHARVLSRPSPVPALHGTWVIRDGYVVPVCGVQER